jgi:hypothetical protein
MSELLSDAGVFQDSVGGVTTTDSGVHGDVLAGGGIDPPFVITLAATLESPTGFR